MTIPRLLESGAAWEATASLDLLTSLIINGERMHAQVASVLRDVKHTRSIDGVNTLSLDIFDNAQKLLESGIFNRRNTVRIEDRDFETVQVRKSGPTLSLTFEDLLVSSLRKRDTPFKVAPNTTNHVLFVQRLVKEVPGAGFFHPPGLVPRGKAPTELARGNPAERTKEDSWTAIRRVGDERGWRAFTRGRTVMYAPETWLLGQRPAYRLTENYRGVEWIDFDIDIGKPVATVKMKVRSKRFELHVGDVIELYSMGPANGAWLINEISRSLFDLHADVTLTKARPVLPEPRPDTTGGSVGRGASRSSTVTFGDGRKRTYNLGAVKPHVRAAAEELGSKFAISTVYGVGQRSNKSDHPLGYALDFMCSVQQGDALSDFAYSESSRLRVKYIIWRQRIRYPGGSWRAMANRGSPTANHEDHVHISFNR